MSQERKMLATLAVTLLLTCAARAAPSAASDEVYGRLIAPCCWNQTLDIHDSELATQLRVEIVERLTHGEASVAIEDDLARRYGERIRAVPRARDPRRSMAVLVVSAMLLALIGLFALARRWARVPGSPEDLREDDARIPSQYDANLDRELSRIESLYR